MFFCVFVLCFEVSESLEYKLGLSYLLTIGNKINSKPKQKTIHCNLSYAQLPVSHVYAGTEDCNTIDRLIDL